MLFGLIRGLTLAIVVMLAGIVSILDSVPAAAAADSTSIRLVKSAHIGWEVDKATRGELCTTTGKDECSSHKPSGERGGFDFPGSVAVDARTGDVYVADLDNYRVQEFTAGGRFISMFGWDVNKTEDARAGKATQEQKNVCTATSHERCGSGLPGTAAGQLDYPVSVAVDPVTSAVYVLEVNNAEDRVDKYTSGGRFVWTIGKGVNVLTKENVCRASEIRRFRTGCKSGRENTTNSLEHTAFKFSAQYGDLLAVGPRGTLYIGDEHRLQEFDADGKWIGEIMLASASSRQASSVVSVAVGQNGEVYLVYREILPEFDQVVEHVDIVRKFSPRGDEVSQFPIMPRLGGATVHIDGIAIDTSGRIAVIGFETVANSYRRFGSIYDGDGGSPIGEFPPPTDNDGLTFNSNDDLYVAATDDQEVVAYVPGPAYELIESPGPCEIAAPADKVAAFSCALNAAQ
jgi:hypothetical protein